MRLHSLPRRSRCVSRSESSERGPRGPHLSRVRLQPVSKLSLRSRYALLVTRNMGYDCDGHPGGESMEEGRGRSSRSPNRRESAGGMFHAHSFGRGWCVSSFLHVHANDVPGGLAQRRLVLGCQCKDCESSHTPPLRTSLPPRQHTDVSSSARRFAAVLGMMD